MSANKPNRRQFLGTAGLVGAGAVLSSCAQVFGAPTAKNNIDLAILNFALNLEYLEAAFYLTAVGRLGELDSAGGSSARVTLNANAAAKAKDGKGTITDPTLHSIVTEIANDELNHVKALRAALKSSGPVDQPQLDLGAAFQAAGSAASNGAITGFDPFANDLFFLHGAFIFEDVGVTAYKGAAILVTDDSVGGVLDTAAGILAVEAYHAGYVRTVLFQQRATVAAAGLNVAQIVAAISALRAKVGGGKDEGITSNGTATGDANLVPTDPNSVAYGRSTAEVLAIVYLGGTGKGGFFPNGLNGTIK